MYVREFGLAQTIGSKFESSISLERNSKSQNFFADKILEMLSAENSNRNNSHAPSVARTAYPRDENDCYWAPLMPVSPSPSLIRFSSGTIRIVFTHYRRYYRQCCAYPHAWLEPVAVNLSFVFLLCFYYAPPLHHTIEASLWRGVRGVDALRILRTGTMDREWCGIYERIAVLERLPTVRQQRPFAPSTEFIVRLYVSKSTVPSSYIPETPV